MSQHKFWLMVTGGRHYANQPAVWDALDEVHYEVGGITLLIHGATPTKQGADWLADAWAKARGVPVKQVPVDTKFDGPWPNAGRMRNARMLMHYPPDGIMAWPGGPGTQDMMVRADLAGYIVRYIDIPDTGLNADGSLVGKG
jgi:hypothetical protein